MTFEEPPTGLIPWFSKTEGNTYATLLHHPFLLKGKLTQCSRGSMERATDLLEIIHTDVCGPMNIEACGGYRYFLTFTDDLSRYGYIYLMKLKQLKSSKNFRVK